MTFCDRHTIIFKIQCSWTTEKAMEMHWSKAVRTLTQVLVSLFKIPLVLLLLTLWLSLCFSIIV